MAVEMNDLNFFLASCFHIIVKKKKNLLTLAALRFFFFVTNYVTPSTDLVNVLFKCKKVKWSRINCYFAIFGLSSVVFFFFKSLINLRIFSHKTK